MPIDPDQFKLIHQPEEDEQEEFLEVEKPGHEEEAETPEQLLKKAKKQKQKRLLIVSAILVGVTIVLIGAVLLFTQTFTLINWTDAVSFAFIVEFAFAWILFVYNYNVLSPLIHGTKTFLNMLVGKRMKINYYDYMKKIQDNPLPKYIYVPVFISSAILGVAMVILLVVCAQVNPV